MPTSLFPPALLAQAEQVLDLYKARGLMLATAESCTGGLVAAILTEIAGSSAVVDRGFVTYTNAAKTDLVGVPAELIDTHGAVSRPVAERMALGALSRSRAHGAVAITGIAGPGGGSPDKPVGLVHFAAASGETLLHRERRFGPLGRADIRLAAVGEALALLATVVDAQPAPATPR